MTWVPTLEALRQSCYINEDGCWIWRGDRYSNGQPRTQIEPTPSRRRFPAKRLALRLTGKMEPSKWGACRCDLEPEDCINPEHLRNYSRSKLLKKSNQDNRAVHVVRIARGVAAKRSASKDMSIELAREIRVSHETASALAERLNISEDRTKSIKSGRSWKELSGLGGVLNG